MKILVINGSPRKNGNTSAALGAVVKGLASKYGEQSIEVIRAYELAIRPCVNCDGCKKNGENCVLPDGTADLMNRIAAADMLIFGSPVYWWGISSKLKSVVDKFYSKESFHNQKKKIGLVTVGASGLEDPQYRLISEQFKCIASFLGWSFVLDEAASAWEPGALAKNAAVLAHIEDAAKQL